MTTPKEATMPCFWQHVLMKQGIESQVFEGAVTPRLTHFAP
jgi:hypothetical protein